MKNFKTLFMASVALVSSASILAQEAAEEQSDWSVSAGADVVSSYVWRGTHCAGASVQPSLTVSYKGLSLGAWGSTDFDNAIDEFDLSLGFAQGGFSATFTDYFFPTNGIDLIGDRARGGYFEWDKETTGHQLELALGYDFGENTSVPLSVTWATFLGGADLKDNGDRQFSSYIELGSSIKVKEVGVDFALGFTPWQSLYQEDKHFNMVNLSIKGSYEIEFTDKFSLPVFTQLVLNPNTENVYFVAGFSF